MVDVGAPPLLPPILQILLEHDQSAFNAIGFEHLDPTLSTTAFDPAALAVFSPTQKNLRHFVAPGAKLFAPGKQKREKAARWILADCRNFTSNNIFFVSKSNPKLHIAFACCRVDIFQHVSAVRHRHRRGNESFDGIPNIIDMIGWYEADVHRVIFPPIDLG